MPGRLNRPPRGTGTELMADDHDSRHRSNSPLSGVADQSSANDPLAELARLIGQSGPASEHSQSGRTMPDSLRSDRPLPPGTDNLFGDDTSYRPSADTPSRVTSPPPPSYAASPPPPYASSPPPPSYAASPPPSYDPSPPPPPTFEEELPPALMNPPPELSHDPLPFLGRDRAAARPHDGSRADWPGSPPAVEPEVDPFRLPNLPLRQAPEPSVAADSYFDNRDYTEPSIGLDSPGLDSPRADFDPPPRFLGEPERPALGPSIYPQESNSGPMPAPHDDEFYDDAPRKGRRKGLLTVAAVLVLAVVGTAGAFGYRNYLSRSHAVPPPVIKASGEPSKVAPPPAAAAAQAESSASKFSYDRFGDRGKDEQVVVREEKPVDSKEIARSAVPRAAISTAPAASTPPPPPATAAPSALGEPRKVRTVQIRPDQVEPSTTPQNVTAAPPNPLAPTAGNAPPVSNVPPPAANAQAVPAVPPPPANAQAVVPPPRSTSTRVATRGATAPQPTRAANAPLSLTPGSGAAAATPPPRAPRVASAPVASGAGNFLVQVSSQRSEADAESAFKTIQAKHASVLSGRPHLVRRADLGSKGVYYRAMVGPFASRDQAVQLCSDLKAAGGSCVVQTN